jgi:hypothetical protein
VFYLGEDVMSNELFSDKEYKAWVKELKLRIKQSQLKAAVKVNAEMIDLYWSIGADIAEKQSIEGWGSKVIPQLSKDLHSEFPNVEGFSVTNLKLMKRFFIFYSKLGTSLVPNFEFGEFGYQAGTQIETDKKWKSRWRKGSRQASSDLLPCSLATPY